MTAALDIIGLEKSFGGLHVTRGVSLRVERGEILAVIGPNGAGKTTLIAQICGDISSDAGEIRIAGEDVRRLRPAARVKRGLSRSFQITQLASTLSVADNMLLACAAANGRAWSFLSPAQTDRALVDDAMAHLARAGMTTRADVAISDLSHGERKQLELALALAANPSILLLDEPMAGLGIAESNAMVERIKALKGGPGILLVEHDMAAVFELADRIMVLAGGEVVATGSPDDIRANPDVRRVYLGY